MGVAARCARAVGARLPGWYLLVVPVFFVRHARSRHNLVKNGNGMPSLTEFTENTENSSTINGMKA